MRWIRSWSGSAKNPGFWPGDSDRALATEKAGLRQSPASSRSCPAASATREAGLFSQRVPPRRWWRGWGLRGVSHRGWIRRGLAARRIPAFGLAIRIVLRNGKSRASAKPGFFPVMPGCRLSCAKPGFFRSGYHRGVAGVAGELRGVSHRGWIRRGLAARRIPAFGLAIRIVLRNGKSRASAKPGFFPVMPGCERATREAGLFCSRYHRGVDGVGVAWRLRGVSHRGWIRRGLAARRIPAFGLAIRIVLRRRKKPGFGKARLLPGHARLAAAMREAGLFCSGYHRGVRVGVAGDFAAFLIAGGSVAVWQREESRLSAWRFGACFATEKAGLRQSPASSRSCPADELPCAKPGFSRSGFVFSVIVRGRTNCSR